MTELYKHPITPPPPHLLKKFSAQAQDETKKRNGAGYLKTFATLCIEWAMSCQSTSNDRQIRSSEIQPPAELIQQWVTNTTGPDYEKVIATQAARWGADQELEACCEWMRNAPFGFSLSTSSYQLRNSRRPKPPSLKEQALEALTAINSNFHVHEPDADIIRRALEALPND